MLNILSKSTEMLLEKKNRPSCSCEESFPEQKKSSMSAIERRNKIFIGCLSLGIEPA